MDYMTTIMQVAIFVLFMVTGTYSQCNQIKFKNAMHYPSYNGIYHIDYDLVCDDKNVYISEGGMYSMYHMNGWWYVHDVVCTPLAHEDSTFRNEDLADYPEYINGTWEEKYGSWYENQNAAADCYYSDGTDLSTGAIIGICFACIIGLAIIIGIPVYICTHKKKSRAPHMEVRVASGVPTAQTYSIQLPPGQQQQQQNPPTYYETQTGYMEPTKQDVVIIQ